MFDHSGTGCHVFATPILSMTPREFAYGDKIEILGPRNDLQWASAGMHTFNAHRLRDGTWIVLVDGWWDDANHATFRCLEAGELECQLRATLPDSKLESTGFLKYQHNELPDIILSQVRAGLDSPGLVFSDVGASVGHASSTIF